MTNNNQLTLAVAGSRKTQGIVDACAASATDKRILILTYTTVNQDELRSRLASHAGGHANIEVMGWFSFLITHFVRPFLPFAFHGKRVRGFDFESPPPEYAKNISYSKYFNSSDQVRRVHLSQAAALVENASAGAAVKRLARMYDVIYIDEVQDLCGYDLEILRLLMDSPIPIDMVGDVRQAVLVTNDREKKHKKYMYMGIWNWFREQEKAGRLTITQRAETWRCRAEIAALADSLFGVDWGFDQTVSLNDLCTAHDGIYLVRECDVPDYLDSYSPLFLRYSANSAKGEPYEFMNFTVSKGLSREHVLIWPTAAIKKLLADGTPLPERTAAQLYVAVTRASQSVAFVMDSAAGTVPFWSKPVPTDP
ncbi:hypothetical protein ACQPXM_13305 [Kribbella sp. CA-253562]|uniref:hypothetical protein n=1 Tax=Kribbella sp. CA-253562 TaxID=3239942 RepID=UPI003D8C9673